MHSVFLFFLCVFSTFNLYTQNLQSPSKFLGYPLGTQFTPHHRVVDYFNYVAANSTLVQLEPYGQTYEGRLLQLAYISTSENIKNLESIKNQHLSKLGLGETNTGNEDAVVVWLSYNVHGNESSSTEASMITLYRLLTEKQEWLGNMVIIMDPCLNPDGRERYVNWYKQVRSRPYNLNKDAKEHHEPWPGGRPNHYLFDLNRDWAWATQTESRQRLKKYNDWLPHIHVDFHEQGINEPYYFAPAAEPYHEVITPWQRNFQIEIGKNHARYFDKEGWLYFTKERFDLFYPSYGDTYPTYLGAIGMTYEQAGHGRAGLGIINEEKTKLTLVDRISHHTTTGLSTVEMAFNNAERLKTELKAFFKNPTNSLSYILKGNRDRLESLKQLLDLHKIKYSYTGSEKIRGTKISDGSTTEIRATPENLVVSTNQPKGKMVKVLFEPQSKLSDSLTYDITAWALPFAYGLETIRTKSKLQTTSKDTHTKAKNSIKTDAPYAYINKWNDVKDAAFLSALLQNNFTVRFSEVPFRIEGKDFEAGSLIIAKGENKRHENFHSEIEKFALKYKRQLTRASTGFVENGADFGSPKVKKIEKKRVVLLSGNNISSLSFGATWHFFEQQFKYPITILDTRYLNKIELNKYDVIIMPEGNYRKILHKSAWDKLIEWVKKGGKVIALGSALKSLAGKKELTLQMVKTTTDSISADQIISYRQTEREKISSLITGSVYKARVDNTHPLAFGYPNYYHSLKLNKRAFKLLPKGQNTAWLQKNAQSVSGFTGAKVQKDQSSSLLFGVEKKGKGHFIYFVDDPLFRGFWENGKLFMANAVLLVGAR